MVHQCIHFTALPVCRRFLQPRSRGNTDRGLYYSQYGGSMSFTFAAVFLKYCEAVQGGLGG